MNKPLFRLTTSLCILVSTLLLLACTIKFGKEFDPQAFQTWIKREESTLTQVREHLGAPQSTGIVVEADGSEYKRWIYYYGKGKLTNMKDAKLKILEIRFNKQQKVASYNWSAE